jgi:NAD(P)-dependent dehydrogenase (short-subunit alcohol dehydrogenase family)
VDAFGRLDIVVDNVGGALPRPFLATTPRHLADAFGFNVAVAHSLTRAAVPHLLAAADGGTGAVVSITSAVGRAAGRGYLAYGTAKAALAHYARLAAADLPPRIRVNAVAVGAVATSALDVVLTDEQKRAYSQRKRRQEERRFAGNDGAGGTGVILEACRAAAAATARPRPAAAARRRRAPCPRPRGSPPGAGRRRCRGSAGR